MIFIVLETDVKNKINKNMASQNKKTRPMAKYAEFMDTVSNSSEIDSDSNEDEESPILN